MDESEDDEERREPVECPHCGNPTMPNALQDGSLVCSCPAERALPPPDGSPSVPPPVDDVVPPPSSAAAGDAPALPPPIDDEAGR
jgi:hypothetical protein